MTIVYIISYNRCIPSKGTQLMTYKEIKKYLKSYGLPEASARHAARAIAEGKTNAYTENLYKWGIKIPG